MILALNFVLAAKMLLCVKPAKLIISKMQPIQLVIVLICHNVPQDSMQITQLGLAQHHVEVK